MSEIKYNTDSFTNELKSSSSNCKKIITECSSLASKVYFPDGDFNWGDVVSKINNCVEKADKYNNWAEDIKVSYLNTVTNMTNNLSEIKLEDLKLKKFSVK